MNLSHGGHLTHGHPLNFSGRFYNVVAYGVRKEDERIDYDAMAALAQRAPPEGDRGRAPAPTRGSSTSPRVRRGRRRVRRRDHGRHRAHRRAWWRRACTRARCRTPSSSPPPPTRRCAGRAAAWSCARRSGRRSSTASCSPACRAGRSCTSSRPRRWPSRRRSRPEFKAYQQQIVANAQALAATLAGEGWRLVSGGTDNHLMLIDVFARGHHRQGRRRRRSTSAGITVNKNTIPFDTNSPMVASGHPHRHAGPHHARHEGGGDGAGRPADVRARSQRSTTRPSSRRCKRDVQKLCDAVPALRRAPGGLRGALAAPRRA